VAEPSELAGQLEAWLAAQGTSAAVTITGRATVGLSQETWFAQLTVAGTESEIVLRLPTRASGGQAILGQRLALRAVAGTGVPAPELLWSDVGSDNPFGRPLLVMARVPGTVPVGWHELAEPRRTALAEQAVDVLATLHAIDPAPLSGLVSPGRHPPTALEWYVHFLARFEPLPAVLRAGLWWLARHRPQRDAQTTLVHGDFRMGNLAVLDDQITGVLDWEMAAPGDPLADLAWCFIPVWEVPGVDEPALVARYERATGQAVDPEQLRWHRVLGFVRLAYYALSGTAAFDSGRSDDLRLAALRLQLPIHLDRLAATLAGDDLS
jgi:aminoglycoside phosphotransferase (APT) family kinase protein